MRDFQIIGCYTIWLKERTACLNIQIILLMCLACSNVDKVREFIKNVYVDKKYTLEKSSDRPPRDPQVTLLDPDVQWNVLNCF